MAKLDVQELVRNNQPIYVYNRTGKYLEKQGPYVLEIRDGNRRAAQVIIPATKYPFLVSGHVPAKLLAESTEFYAALSKGILELADPDAARKIMESSIAQQVQEQALRRFQPVRRESKAPPELTPSNRTDLRPSGADKGISGLPETSTPLVVAGARGEDGKDDELVEDVNATVLQIVMDLNSDSALYEEKFLELAGMEGLTDLDYGYLLSNCKKFPKILQLAKAELANLVGDDGLAEIEAEQELDDGNEKPTRRRRHKRR